MAVDTIKRNKRQAEWKKENADRIGLLFEKGTKEKLDAASKVLGVTRSEFVRQAIAEKLERMQEKGL